MTVVINLGPVCCLVHAVVCSVVWIKGQFVMNGFCLLAAYQTLHSSVQCIMGKCLYSLSH